MKTMQPDRKGAKLRISEIYASRQGEGLLTGTPSIFVRTSGCNLRCWFCDTPFASWRPEGDFVSESDIVDELSKFSQRHVVLTGGEPMIYRHLDRLCAAIRHQQRHLTIETAGTLYRDVDCDLMSISPKLAGSTPKGTRWENAHEQRRERLDVVARLIRQHDYQLKFVVDQLSDAEEVLRYLGRLGSCDQDRVLLMPQGTEIAALNRQAEWLEPWCQEHGFRFCPRAHIQWYGNVRGT